MIIFLISKLNMLNPILALLFLSHKLFFHHSCYNLGEILLSYLVLHLLFNFISLLLQLDNIRSFPF